MSHARKLRRSAVRREDDGTLPMGRVGMLAGISLGLSDEQATDALNALAGFRATDPTAGALFARMLELVDLARREGIDDGLPAELNTAAERAKLDRSFGAGFAKHVAAIGQPASAMLSALRTLLLLLALLLWATPGNAALRGGALVRGAHKIQRRNRDRRRRNVGPVNQPAYHHRRGWIRSSRKSAGSLRLSSSSPSFETGYECEPTSSGNRAKSSKSSWSGGAVASTSAACPRVIPISRLSVATVRSRALHTASAGAFEK